MPVTRAALIIVVVSGLSAAALALLSRTPASIRLDKPPAGATDASHGSSFTDEQIARHGRYRAPAYVSVPLGLVITIATLVAIARGPAGRVLDATASWWGGWVTQAIVMVLFVSVVLFLAQLPLGYVRGFAMEKAWGLSTQSPGEWLLDAARSLGVGSVIAGVSAVAFFAVVRWQPRTWWVIGWVVFTVLTAALAYLYPVTIAPIFNRFTPVADRELAAEIKQLASDAGVTVDRVLVADASRRTTAKNAYVAGLGDTKRVVLYDTLLQDESRPETMFVVAHELAHEAENHVLKGVAVASAGLLVGFAALAWLAGRSWMWSWNDAAAVTDVRVIPVLLLFATIAGALLGPLDATVSRRFEAHADRIAVELTGDPSTAVRAFRELAFSNIGDLRPPAVAVAILYSHPSIPQRIETALEHSGR